LALNLFMPTEEFLRLRTTEPALPAWVMHGNRTKRIEIGVGIAVELFKGISVGLGTELQAQARYRINGTLDMAASAGGGDSEDLGELIEYVRMDVHEMTLDLVPQYVPVAGLHWDVGKMNSKLNGLQLGLAWRGSGGIPVIADIDLQINGSLTDLGELDPIGIALVIPVQFSIFDHYVPERWSLGVAYQHMDLPRVYLDVHHTRWSDMVINVAHVTKSAIRSQIFQVDKDLLIDANQYDTVFKDTISANTGVEVFLPDFAASSPVGALSPVLRGGFGYIPSPLVSQDARTAFLDADRVLFSGGFGLSHADPWALVPGPVSWDVYYSRQQLAKGELMIPESETPRAGAPINGAAIPISGQLWSAGLQFSVSF
jgi:long-subunit fatty acid transport protein